MPESCEQTITLAGDLHARPAGALSVAAAKFASAVRLSVAPAGDAAGAKEVDAKSVLAVMQLGASSGHQVTVHAVGPDAADAVAAVIGVLAQATKVGD
jgi:phosphocarrier protein HPr